MAAISDSPYKHIDSEELQGTREIRSETEKTYYFIIQLQMRICTSFVSRNIHCQNPLSNKYTIVFAYFTLPICCTLYVHTDIFTFLKSETRQTLGKKNTALVQKKLSKVIL